MSQVDDAAYSLYRSLKDSGYGEIVEVMWRQEGYFQRLLSERMDRGMTRLQAERDAFNHIVESIRFAR